jgi:heme/copper-type cytochrome/quinol oxidase subunit 2
MPPVSFSAVNPIKQNVQVVDVTAGQWFWLMHKEGQPPLASGQSPHITIVAGQPVKFVAHSIDVNHGFGIMKGSDDSEVLLQMQVIPKLDNVFYYTFKQPGTYFIRCFEYCGFAHPYMTSIITVIPPPSSGAAGNANAQQQGGLA